MSKVKKQELIHLNKLLEEVDKYLEQIENYESPGAGNYVHPTAIYRSKADHKTAVWDRMNDITNYLEQKEEKIMK